MLERIRDIFRKDNPSQPEEDLSVLGKMEDDIRTKFPDFNIEEYKKPVIDWFKIRTFLNTNVTIGEDLDIYNLNREYDKEYDQFEDNVELNEVLRYITDELGKKSGSIQVK